MVRLMAKRAYCGTMMYRVGDKWLLIISSTETKVLPWESFEKGEGADAVLAASMEDKKFYIEPGEILVGT